MMMLRPRLAGRVHGRSIDEQAPPCQRTSMSVHSALNQELDCGWMRAAARWHRSIRAAAAFACLRFRCTREPFRGLRSTNRRTHAYALSLSSLLSFDSIRPSFFMAPPLNHTHESHATCQCPPNSINKEADRAPAPPHGMCTSAHRLRHSPAKVPKSMCVSALVSPSLRPIGPYLLLGVRSIINGHRAPYSYVRSQVIYLYQYSARAHFLTQTVEL